MKEREEVDMECNPKDDFSSSLVSSNEEEKRWDKNYNICLSEIQKRSWNLCPHLQSICTLLTVLNDANYINIFLLPSNSLISSITTLSHPITCRRCLGEKLVNDYNRKTQTCPVWVTLSNTAFSGVTSLRTGKSDFVRLVAQRARESRLVTNRFIPLKHVTSRRVNVRRHLLYNR